MFQFRLFLKLLGLEETCEIICSDQQVTTFHTVIQILGPKSHHRMTFAAVFPNIMDVML